MNSGIPGALPRLMRISLAMFFLATACGNDHAVEPPAPGDEPVYYGQVQKILDDNCVECHSESPDRLAPFSLANLEAAQSAAEATPLTYSVMNRVMPPYYAKNDGSCQTFHGTKWLADDEIDTLVRWVNGERLAGEVVPSTPPLDPVALPAIDKTLDIGTDYMPKGTSDDYRCFVVDSVATADQYLTGVHVRPGNATVVHHVIVFTINSAQGELAVVQRDQLDGDVGYECTGGAGDETTFLTGWAPGSGVTLFPKDTGLLVPGNRKLVIQVHYNSANANGKADHTQVDLDLAPSVAKRAAILPIRGDVNLAPRQLDALATGTVTLNAGGVQSARVWGAAIHMHNRGTGAQVHVQRADDTCMIDLASWSFHWQHFYWYEQPFTVTKGEKLRVTCHFDTSADTANVTWGEKTTDEMCLAYLYVSI
jgi:Copper type II ascorbate-dependent monooxygenase, C-terminal domain/Copper type II ascorbate-dependent monooxygenase, N-terminal domain